MTDLEELTASIMRPLVGESTIRRLGVITLHVVEGPTAGTRHEIREAQIRVGRGASNEVAIDDVALSIQHVELTLGTAHVVLRDLGSRNGTFLNMQAVAPQSRRILRDNDIIHLGNLQLLVRFQAASKN